MQQRSHYTQCAGREIHYTEWGQPDGPLVMAWHGLARTGRDMDPLATWLAHRGWRVVCPDTIGRGLSQWSPKPQEEYCLDFYARIATELVDQLGAQELVWVGTSMGGAIGTVCAATTLRERIRCLVLNDNAPQLAGPAIARIRAYAGHPPAFDSMLELEAFFRQVYAPYGWLSDKQWRDLTETSVRRLPNGKLTPHYDPAIVQQFERETDDYLIWHHYDTLELPVMCLRGAHSDLVLPDTVAEMEQRGPGLLGCFKRIEISDCGHAPALNTPAQCELVSNFLAAAMAHEAAH